DQPVEADVAIALVVERGPWISTAGMRADRTLEAALVVAVKEVGVAARVGAELGIVTLRGKHERGAALPASDHLRAQERFLLTARRFCSEVLPVRSHPCVQLAKDDVGPVSTEHLGSRHGRQLARLVRVAEDDLAGLERLFTPVRGGNAAALDRRLADPVLEAEGGSPGRKLVAVLTPDQLDTG